MQRPSPAILAFAVDRQAERYSAGGAPLSVANRRGCIRAASSRRRTPAAYLPMCVDALGIWRDCQLAPVFPLPPLSDADRALLLAEKAAWQAFEAVEDLVITAQVNRKPVSASMRADFGAKEKAWLVACDAAGHIPRDYVEML